MSEASLTTHGKYPNYHPFDGTAYKAAIAGMGVVRVCELNIPSSALVPGCSTFNFLGTGSGPMYADLLNLWSMCVELANKPPPTQRQFIVPIVTQEMVQWDEASKKKNKASQPFAAVRVRLVCDNSAPKRKDRTDAKSVERDEREAEDLDYAAAAGVDPEAVSGDGGDEKGGGGGGGGWKSGGGGGRGPRIPKCPADSGRIGRGLWNHIHGEEVRLKELAKKSKKRTFLAAQVEYTPHSCLNNFRMLVKRCNDYCHENYTETATRLVALDHAQLVDKALNIFDVFNRNLSITKHSNVDRLQSEVVRYNSYVMQGSESVEEEIWHEEAMSFPYPNLVWRVNPATMCTEQISQYVFPFAELEHLSEREIELAIKSELATVSTRRMYQLVFKEQLRAARAENVQLGADHEEKCARTVKAASMDSPARVMESLISRSSKLEFQGVIDSFKRILREREEAKERKVSLEASDMGFRAMGEYHAILKSKAEEALASLAAKLKADDEAAVQAREAARMSDVEPEGKAERKGEASDAALQRAALMQAKLHQERAKGLRDYKDGAFARLLNLWSNGKKRSASLKAIEAWGRGFLNSKSNKLRTFTFPASRSYSNLGDFAGRITEMLRELELCFRLTNTHMTLLRGLLSVFTVYSEDPMNVHTVWYGAHQAGKSFLIKLIEKLLIKGSTMLLNYSSHRAGAVDGTYDDEIQMYEDAEASQIGLKGSSGKGVDKEAGVKAALTGNQQASRTLGFDEAGNRVQVHTQSSNANVVLLASNEEITSRASKAVQNRYYMERFLATGSTNSLLIHKSSTRENENEFKRWAKVIEDRTHRDQYFVAFISKAILTNAFTYDGSIVDAVISKTLTEFDKRGGDESFSIRNKTRISKIAFVLTALNATWRHFDDPHSKFFNKEFEWDDLKEIEQHLVCSEEIAAFAVSLMAGQYEEVLMYEVLFAIERDVLNTREVDGSPSATRPLEQVYMPLADKKVDPDFVSVTYKLPTTSRWYSTEPFVQLVNLVHGGLCAATRRVTDKQRVANILEGLRLRPYIPPGRPTSDETTYLSVCRKRFFTSYKTMEDGVTFVLDQEGKRIGDKSELKDVVVMPTVLIRHNHRYPIEDCLRTVLQTTGRPQRTIIVGTPIEGFPWLPRAITLMSPEDDAALTITSQRIASRKAGTLRQSEERISDADAVVAAITAMSPKWFTIHNPTFMAQGYTDICDKTTSVDPRLPKISSLFTKDEFVRIEGDVDAYYTKRHLANLGLTYREEDCHTEDARIRRNVTENPTATQLIYPDDLIDAIKSDQRKDVDSDDAVPTAPLTAFDNPQTLEIINAASRQAQESPEMKIPELDSVPEADPAQSMFEEDNKENTGPPGGMSTRGDARDRGRQQQQHPVLPNPKRRRLVRISEQDEEAEPAEKETGVDEGVEQADLEALAAFAADFGDDDGNPNALHDISPNLMKSAKDVMAEEASAAAAASISGKNAEAAATAEMRDGDDDGGDDDACLAFGDVADS